MFLQPIILCGGSGTRLWPLSTPTIPKQFISLGPNGTFLEQTLGRCRQLTNSVEPYLMTNKNSPTTETKNVITELYSNDTTVAIARVCRYFEDLGTSPDQILLFLPADHYIKNTEVFLADIDNGIKKITDKNIVLFGIQPTSPETKYGYILSTSTGLKFKEKPDHREALILMSNNAMWNSGIIMTKLGTLLKIFDESGYDIWDWVDNPREGKAPSFDVAILQEYKELTCHHCQNWGWSDVGTWSSFLDLPEVQDEILSNTAKTLSCRDVSLINKTNIPVAIIGCDDLLVILTNDGILITNKNNDCSNELKNYVSNNLYKKDSS